MAQIIPIKDLKNTGEISNLCNSTNEPIYVTKNGYGDMVIMSIQAYEEYCYSGYVRRMLAEAEAGYAAGNKGKPLDDVLTGIRGRHGGK